MVGARCQSLRRPSEAELLSGIPETLCRVKQQRNCCPNCRRQLRPRGHQPGQLWIVGLLESGLARRPRDTRCDTIVGLPGNAIPCADCFGIVLRLDSRQGRTRVRISLYVFFFESCCAHLNTRTFIAKTRETRVFLGDSFGSHRLLRIVASARGRLLLRILPRFVRAFDCLANVLGGHLPVVRLGDRLRIGDSRAYRLHRKVVGRTAFLSGASALRLESVMVADGLATIAVIRSRPQGSCPICGQPAAACGRRQRARIEEIESVMYPWVDAHFS
jgi:hypothetical protein